MLSLLFLVSLCIAENVYVCQVEIEKCPTLNTCSSVMELDLETVGSGDSSTATCFVSSEKSSFLVYNKEEEGTTVYYIMNFEDALCQGSSLPTKVAFSSTFDTQKPIIIVTLDAYQQPVEILIKQIKGATTTATQYILNNICVNGQKFISSQFGVSSHIYSNLDCSGTDTIVEIFTDSYKSKSAIIKKVTLDTEIEFTLSSSSNLKIVESIPLGYVISESLTEIIELTSATEGKVYESTDNGFVLNTEKTVSVINQEKQVGSGVVCKTECSESNGKAYFYSDCSLLISYSVIGDNFVQITFEDNKCEKPIEVVSAKDKKITVNDITYQVTHTPVFSGGRIYVKKSEIEYQLFNLGICLKVSTSSSTKIFKEIDNKYVSASFTNSDCTSEMKIVYIKDVLEVKPFDGNARLIQSNNECHIKEKEDEVITDVIKTNTCCDTFKYVIEDNKIVKYTFENKNNCESNVNGTASSNITCGSCEFNSYALCEVADPTDPENGSSSITLLMVVIAIAFFIF